MIRIVSFDSSIPKRHGPALKLPPAHCPILPEEVLSHVAEYLDVASALSLSRTCKGFQNAGEMKIWEVLHIAADVHCTRLTSRRHHTQEHEIVKQNIQTLASAMRNRPNLIGYISTLTIQPTRFTQSVLADLLGLVAPQLKKLVVHYNTGDSHYGDYDTRNYHDHLFYRLVSERNIQLPRLVDLDVTLEDPTEPLRPLQYFAKAAPNLERLTLDCKRQEDDIAPIISEIEAIPLFPKVTVLYLDHLHAVFMEAVIPTLLRHSLPQLRAMRVGNDNDIYPPCPELLREIQRHSRLKILDAGFLSCDLMTEGTYPSNIQTMVKCVVDTEVEDWKLGSMSYYPKPFSDILHVVYVNPCRPSPEQYSRLPMQHHHQPNMLPDGASSIYGFCNTYPNATDVSFVTHFTDGVFVPAKEWEQDGRRGMLIRDYVRTTPKGTKRFSHGRTLSRCLVEGNPHMCEGWRCRHGRGTVLGGERRWYECAEYDHQKIPRDVFERVYEMLGEKWDWKEGKRGLTLPDAAWDVLDQFVKERRSNAHEEDRFTW